MPVEAVVELRPDLGRALLEAFRRGYLDVPYCLHPDNAGRSRGYLDENGWLRWSRVGSMPIADVTRPTGSVELTADGLLASLSYVERKYDSASFEEHITWPTTSPPPDSLPIHASTSVPRSPDPC
jgi:methylaspartate mutase epsilon subunit